MIDDQALGSVATERSRSAPKTFTMMMSECKLRAGLGSSTKPDSASSLTGKMRLSADANSRDFHGIFA